MSLFMENFTTTIPGVKVRFGAGVRHKVGEEMDALGLKRALILTTPQQAETGAQFARDLGDKAAGVFSGAAMHTPVAISEEATARAFEHGADCVLAIGGGSTTGLGKAIALRTDLVQIVVPTTYAGSEATGILGQTEGGRKTTITTPKVQPEVILYDAELVRSLPVGMTVTSALNAMAHAAEGLYAQNRSPISTLMALEGLRAFRDALPRVLDNPDDLTARGETLYGAWLCGTVLATVGMALHHKLCHTLGGSYKLPHAETHAIVLPHALAYNRAAAPEAMRRIARAIGSDDAAQGIFALSQELGIPGGLREVGMREADLDTACALALANPYWNPRPIDAVPLRDLLQRAWAGHPPLPA